MNGWSRPNHMLGLLEDLQTSGCMRSLCGPSWGLGLHQVFMVRGEARASCMASLSQLRLESPLTGILAVLGGQTEGFGTPKGRSKSVFRKFFCDVFLESVFAAIWVGFF